MLNAKYVRDLGIENILNYNRKSRQDEELEKRTGEDTLKSIRDLMARVLDPLEVPYTQKDEIGSGDKISTRPVFQWVIEQLQEKKYDAIAVKELSRMGRGSYTDMGVIYDLIQENRIFIITPWKVYDPQNKADLRQIRFELFMSREEFETTSERLAGGRFNKAMDGRWVAGAAPFGFDIDDKTGRLKLNEKESKIGLLIGELYAYGIPDGENSRRQVGYRALCTYLYRIGIKSPYGAEWRTDNIKRFLQNDANIGIVRYNATKTVDGKVIKRPVEEHIIVPYAHPPIFTLKLFIDIQKKTESSERPLPVKLDHRPHELTGMTVCHVCGKKMVRQCTEQKYTSKKTGEVNIYPKEFLWCGRPGCTFVKYRHVEESILETLEYLSNLDNDILEETFSKLAIKKKPKNNVTPEMLHELAERRIHDLKQRLKFIFEKHETGIYSDEYFLQRKGEIDAEIDGAEKSKHQTVMQIESEEIIDTKKLELLKTNITSIVALYKTSDDRAVKNAILKNIFEHVEVKIILKGSGKRPAKFDIYPVLKYDIINYDSLAI